MNQSNAQARLLVLITIVACGGADKTAPIVPPGPNTFQLVQGTATDTVGAVLNSSLVVAARTSDGKPRAGANIRFSVLTDTPGTAFGVRLAGMGTDGSVTLTSPTDGVVSLQVTMGDHVGSFAVAVTESGVTHADTARFDVRPGALARAAIVTRDTMTTVGGSYAPSVTTFDRLDNRRSDVPTLNSNNSAVCRGDGTTIVGLSVGNCVIAVSVGSLRDSIVLAVVPPNVKLLATVAGPIDGSLLVSLNLDGSSYKVIRILDIAPFHPFHPAKTPTSPIAVQGQGSDLRLHVMLIDDAGNERPLAPATPTGSDEHSARVSPDGQWIYFSSRPDPSQAYRVWRAHLDGSSTTPITPIEASNGNPSNYADISADGRTLAYANFGMAFKMMDLATGRITGVPITNGPVGSLRADPKLPRFAALMYDFRLFVVNTDGTGLRFVVPDSVSGMLEWLPDGEWIMTRNLTKLGGLQVADGDRILLNVNDGRRVRLNYQVKLGEITVVR